MLNSDCSGDTQYGALPYRFRDDLSIEVMLVSSRGTGRWDIPKGWAAGSKKPHLVAEEEAFQAAGVRGKVSPAPRGSYSYSMTRPGWPERLLFVELFPMLVTKEFARWPASRERMRCWFSTDVAASLVAESALSRTIGHLTLTNRHWSPSGDGHGAASR